MTQADGVEIVAPKVLIIPNNTTLPTTQVVSGMIVLSGQQLFYKASSGWYHISGALVHAAT